MWLSAGNPSRAAELETSALVRALERPIPAAIAFKEVRFSALLEQPLVVSGELKYVAQDHLERLVTSPYKERTVIRGESVRVERHGEKLRTFALNRAPELKGMLMAFSGLLAGNVELVKQHFDVRTQGSEESWSMQLTPLDPRAQKQLEQLRMTGRNNEPTCFFMTSAGGGHSVMLLGALADRPIDAGATPETLDTLCTNDSAR